MKRAIPIIALALLCLGLAACAAPEPRPSVAPQDLDQLPGEWVQLVPVQALPEKLALDGSGHAQADTTGGTWRVQDGKLWLRLGSAQSSFEYTVSGYMMTLVDDATGTSSFYINPKLFSAQGDDNTKFAGRWASYSTYGMMDFDGKGTLQDIYYDKTAGRQVRSLQYTARDNILQAIDGEGNVIYNLYSFEDNTLKLADTGEYDSDQKNWTLYWKKQDNTDIQAKWTRKINQTVADAPALPEVLELQTGGKALQTPSGGNPTPISWEYYDGDFIVLYYSDTNVQYAYVSKDGPTLLLESGEDTRCWYATDALRGALHTPKELEGKWVSENPDLTLTVKADGAMTFTTGGKDYPATASAGGMLLIVKQNGKEYCVAFDQDDTQLTLSYVNAPFLPDGEKAVVLTKE